MTCTRFAAMTRVVMVRVRARTCSKFAVIPAKAGIQYSPALQCLLDPRVRGDDERVGRGDDAYVGRGDDARVVMVPVHARPCSNLAVIPAKAGIP